MHDLKLIGWSDDLQRAFDASSEPNQIPARVTIVERGRYQLLATADSEPVWATVAGRMAFEAADGLDAPSVGDWVVVTHTRGSFVITQVLPRRSVFVRKGVGQASRPQTIATNIDHVLIVTAADDDLSPRRLERYMAAVWAGGAEPVIVVNKTDLITDWAAVTQAVNAGASGAPVAYVSASSAGGLRELHPFVTQGKTLALVGSSGVGKSTLTNALLGLDAQLTQAVRDGDHKGRHTTTRRQLFLTPEGAIVIDTPGMREFGLWQADDGLSSVFGDIEGFAASCRYRDCAHSDEPGCAVQQAVREGHLAPERLTSFEKLQRELAHEQRRSDPVANANTKQRWKTIHKAVRARNQMLQRTGGKG